jgi:hypothetical protein
MGDVIGHALAMLAGLSGAVLIGTSTAFIYEKIEKVFNNE